MPWAAPEDCPFAVNTQRFNQQTRGDHWDGGYYFEVLSSAVPGHRFWGSDLKVVIDFGRREYKFTTTGCDEDAGHIIVRKIMRCATDVLASRPCTRAFKANTDSASPLVPVRVPRLCRLGTRQARSQLWPTRTPS